MYVATCVGLAMQSQAWQTRLGPVTLTDVIIQFKKDGFNRQTARVRAAGQGRLGHTVHDVHLNGVVCACTEDRPQTHIQTDSKTNILTSL